MNKMERREQLLELIRASHDPISASTLAISLKVSRQIIVGDIALLRASGVNISATPTGYVLDREKAPMNFGYIGTIACRHFEKDLADELYTIVDFGGTVIDVTIEHNTYGQISGILDISSRHDADKFLEKLNENQDKPLSDLTGGIHLHRIGCRNEATFELLFKSLVDKGIALT